MRARIGLIVGLMMLVSLFLNSSYAAPPQYRVDALKEAHRLFNAATNTAEFALAAHQYEYLVSEEKIRNGQLFYTLANAYFMSDDLGRAILNYRRAERYLPSDENVQANLQAALNRRVDMIDPVKPASNSFFVWLIDAPPSFLWKFFACSYLLAWALWWAQKRWERKDLRISSYVLSGLSTLLFLGLILGTVASRRSAQGVIISNEVLARKGDGEMYSLAFLDPLHAGTEFYLLENRESWWKIELADQQTCWIPAQAAELEHF